jgi:hypothetical protein
MKKFVIATLMALAAVGASAADYVTIDIDSVKDNVSGVQSTAQYIRAGKEIGGVQYGLQGRTAVSHTGGMFHSLELTGGKAIGAFTPFIGVGFDAGANGARNADYQYGLVGATTGMKVGPGFALAGVKTRVGTTAAVETKQTVAFATYSIPVAKKISLNVNASKSYQDIKETAYGVGVSFSF